MPELTRRSVLAGSAAAGLTLLASRGVASAAPRRVPTTREEHRVVVVGSGFGGGVTALRFAQAGIPVLVLERGKRWVAGPGLDTFPSFRTGLDERIAWKNSLAAPLAGPLNSVHALLGLIGPGGNPLGLPSPLAGPHLGLLERVAGNGMDIMCAAGVGGGSLAYQGMSLQPTRPLFEATMPAGLDYDELDRVHYPRVAQMLRLATAPDSIVETPNYTTPRTFARRTQAAGYAVEKVPMPLDWSYAQRELDGEMPPSMSNGDCGFGVNNGGKNSVDVTYLAQAEATGRVTVAAQHEVTDVVRLGDGRWQLLVDRLALDGTVLEHKVVTTTALVMAAGTAGTVRLLMRAQQRGGIPDLPDGLGEGWGSNGDRICVWLGPGEELTMPQGGPVVYCSKEWDDPATANTIIQASIPPLPQVPVTMVVGYGISEGRGRFRWDHLRDDAVLDWSPFADARLATRIRTRMAEITGPGALVLDTTTPAPSTWHPLGGAAMGSVCDLEGRVAGQRGLYVLDGALIPGNTAACNPSLTIAAVVERATDRLLATDAGTVF
ncbi:GMC oxidoreductase [Klenkia sp. LSe6-5]|uniref:Cholesterol oxidase n=1 Tax=Klenkia sesuvii TaxID=3103137 RepID=A0ABU8DZ71_9ACTN